VFKNKHVVIAIIVAPILSILAWVGVGQFTGEQPQLAQPGQSYPLLEKSNCRYNSGACDLANEDFKFRLTLQDDTVGPEILLTSTHPLEGVVLAVGVAGTNPIPVAMRASDGNGLEWRIALKAKPGPAERIRIAASADGSSYFADASTTFLQPRG
jgi:hypothetical protein